MLDHRDAIVNDVKIYLILTLHIHNAMKIKRIMDIHYIDNIHKDIENMIKNVKVEELSKA